MRILPRWLALSGPPDGSLAFPGMFLLTPLIAKTKVQYVSAGEGLCAAASNGKAAAIRLPSHRPHRPFHSPAKIRPGRPDQPSLANPIFLPPLADGVGPCLRRAASFAADTQVGRPDQEPADWAPRFFRGRPGTPHRMGPITGSALRVWRSGLEPRQNGPEGAGSPHRARNAPSWAPFRHLVKRPVADLATEAFGGNHHRRIRYPGLD
jgi:hypothetical protein